MLQSTSINKDLEKYIGNISLAQYSGVTVDINIQSR